MSPFFLMPPTRARGIRLPTSTFQQVEEVIERRGIRLNDFLKEAVMAALEKQNAPTDNG